MILLDMWKFVEIMAYSGVSQSRNSSLSVRMEGVEVRLLKRSSSFLQNGKEANCVRGKY